MQHAPIPPFRRLARWFPSVLVAGAFALAACDGDDTTAPSSGGPDAAAPASTGPQSLCYQCPVSDRIAYVRLVNSTTDIYTMDGDGKRVSEVTITPYANEYDPSWAPDHAHVVFTRTQNSRWGMLGGIWRTDEYGAGPQITTFWGDRGASWGKNGKIAFHSFRDTGVSSSNEIYTINDNGTGLVRLTNNSGDDRNPDWSPNGSKIAFASDGGVPLGHLHLFVMNGDGTGRKQLTFGTHEDQPAWSPDGSRIAFFGNNGSYPAVYVMNADGTNIKEVVKGMGPAPYGGTQLYFVGEPSWSENGLKLAFTTDVSGHHEIYTVNVDGTGLHDSSLGAGVVDANASWSK
jgi:Tol biopolymer transport system component